MTALEFRNAIDEHGKLGACKKFFPSCKNERQAEQIIYSYVMRLLTANNKAAAAIILWGDKVFNPRPKGVRRVWAGIERKAKILIQGAGSYGKSYTVCAWLLLDWWTDPNYTNIKIISATSKHAKSNTFSTIVRLLQSTLVKMPGEATGQYIGLDAKEKKSGIEVIAIPQGDDGKGRLQGFHPDPRPKAHPVFGVSSRIRAFLDECEEVPLGVWQGIANLLLSMSGRNTIKVIGAYNPKDQSSKTAQEAEPEEGGWEEFDVETGVRGQNEWISKHGWYVIRLDGKQMENVEQRREVFPGFITIEGYRNLESKNGGNSPEYWCADTETEVLSKRGWLRHQEVKVKDFIYTVNPATGKSEWARVDEVFAKHYNGPMISLENRSFSALVTPNHRWAVTNKYRASRSAQLVFRETDSLKRHDLIPVARPSDGGKSGITPALAELLGWIVTDGSYQPTGNGTRVMVYQSEKSNPEKCERIRSLLVRLMADHREFRANGIISFRISGELSRKIRKLAPSKKLTIKLIDSLSNRARESLLGALIAGDGGIQGHDTSYICAASKEQAGVYAALVARLGFSSTTHERIIPAGTFPNGLIAKAKTMFYVNIRKSAYARVQHLRPKARQYSGVVWCPRTKNGTFLARRRGTTYFTGNTFARGAYPPIGVNNIIIPSSLLARARGDFLWVGIPINVGSVDTAVDGRDECVYTKGRAGLAYGFRHAKTGKITRFKTQRVCAQIDQQFEIKKGDTKIVGDDIIKNSKALGVTPEYFGLDSTGNGSAVWSYLCAVWGECLGVNFSESATKIKILEEDKRPAEDVYDGLHTEVWYAMRYWMEFGYCALAPGLRTDPLDQELMGRRYVLSNGQLVRCEKKEDYKKRLGHSPDYADSATVFVHVVRMREAVMGYMSGGPKAKPAPQKAKGVVEKVAWLVESGV